MWWFSVGEEAAWAAAAGKKLRGHALHRLACLVHHRPVGPLHARRLADRERRHPAGPRGKPAAAAGNPVARDAGLDRPGGMGPLSADRPALAWASVGILVAIALLGFTMFARWIPVYRTPLAVAGPQEQLLPIKEIPAEGNFPLVIVVAHGTFAVSTLVLVVLTALGFGGS